MAHARLALLVAVLGALLGCNKPKGNCDARADKAKTCTEVLKSSLVESTKRECVDNPITHAKGTWADGACPRVGVIGACQTSSTRTWHYEGGRATKIEHVASGCAGKVIAPDGNVVGGVIPEPWPADTSSPPSGTFGTVVADAKVQAMMKVIDKLKVPSGAPSGTIRPTGGKILKEPAATIWEKDLSGFGSTYRSTEDYPFFKANELRACGVAAEEKKKLDQYSDDGMKRALAWCPTLEYLLVVKTTKYKNAELLNGSQFVPGFAEGHVFAFELPSGAAIGGYSWKAESSKTVTGAPHSGTIEKDFKDKIERALNDGLKKASPGTALQFDL